MRSPHRRRATLVLIWLLGSAVAVAVAIIAVGLAGARVTGGTDLLRARGEVGRASSTVIDANATDAGSVGGVADDPSEAPAEGTSVSGPAAPSPRPASGDDGSSSDPNTMTETDSPQTVGKSPTTPPPTAAATTTSSPSSTGTTETIGGTVKVQCINSSVSLVSAVPRGGYGVEVGNRGPQQVEVQFHSSSHESEVHATCRNGVVSFDDQEAGGGE